MNVNDKLSYIGNNIVGSEIIKISQEIKEISKDKKVLNLTIGDFDPIVNNIPEKLKKYIIDAYNDNLTNYPLSPGQLDLRQSVSTYLKNKHDIVYNEHEILIGAGVRPLIYTIYKTIVDKNDGVIYPVPSWNNNHYTFLHHGNKQEIECTSENNFFPTLNDIKVNIKDNTTLISLCSPQNPTGLVINPEVLKDICYLVVEENNRRNKNNIKPLFLFFDQVYSDLSYDFIHPLRLCPEIKEYLICVDGISKSLCATGVRVGWVFGNELVIKKMTNILSHIGAWAPKPEQTAVAKYLNEYSEITSFIDKKNEQYTNISNKICDVLEDLKNAGFRIDYKKPQGGIYISIYFGDSLSFSSVEKYNSFLINKCGIGLVPFEYFGSKMNRGWYRLSIGNLVINDVNNILSETFKTICVESLTERVSMLF